MPWFSKTQTSVNPCFSVGQYKIDARTDMLPDLKPLSPSELAALNTAVQFDGEQIFHAPGAEFMSLRWDAILGTVHNVIYKIALQWTGPRAQTGKTYVEILRHCTSLYGDAKKMTVWDASDGNIVLDSTNVGPTGVVNLFLTSRQVGSFKRLP